MLLLNLFTLFVLIVKSVFFSEIDLEVLTALVDSFIYLFDLPIYLFHHFSLLIIIWDNKVEIFFGVDGVLCNFRVSLLYFLNQLNRIFHDIFRLRVFLLKDLPLKFFILLFKSDKVTLNFGDQLFMLGQFRYKILLLLDIFLDSLNLKWEHIFVYDGLIDRKKLSFKQLIVLNYHSHLFLDLLKFDLHLLLIKIRILVKQDTMNNLVTHQ